MQAKGLVENVLRATHASKEVKKAELGWGKPPCDVVATEVGFSRFHVENETLQSCPEWGKRAQLCLPRYFRPPLAMGWVLGESVSYG